MPTNRQKAWETRGLGRRSETRERRRVLILCEDSKSARYYFEGFQVDRQRVDLITVGTGMNTDSLVEEAIRHTGVAECAGKPFSEVWCVFDRDSFPMHNFDRAFQLARNSRIKLAWTNEAFELWYLLHFNYHDTGISRNDYKTKLKPHIDYDKADAEIYVKMIPNQETALRNARNLENYWKRLGEDHPERQNPSTAVHKLVEFLNELADLGSTTDSRENTL